MVTVLKATAAESCSAGMEWSDAANRCLVKATTAQTQRDLEACAKLSDAAAQKACYENNATKAANADGTARADGKDVASLYKSGKDAFWLNTAKTATYALPLMLFGYLILKKRNSEKRCLPPSTIAMLVAGVTMMGGEAYGYIKHSSNLKKLNKKRESLFTPKATDNLDQKKVDATQMQSEAFQLLSDEQASVESLAKAKKTFYAVAMSAYAAAAGIATYELLAIKAAKTKLATALATEAMKVNPQNPAEVAMAAKLKALYASLTKAELAKATQSNLDIKSVTAAASGIGTDLIKNKTSKTTKTKDKENKSSTKTTTTNESEVSTTVSENDITTQESTKNTVSTSTTTKDTAGNATTTTSPTSGDAGFIKGQAVTTTLDQITQTAQAGSKPTVAQASMNYKNLLVKYECWEQKTTQPKPAINKDVEIKFDNPIDMDASLQHKGIQSEYKSLRNLKEIYTQLNNIKNASSIEELNYLTEELETIKSGDIQSYYSHFDKKEVIQTKSDKIYMNIHAEITALDTYSEYFSDESISSSEKLLSKIVNTIQNNIAIPRAHAGDGGGLTAILGVIPAIIGASSLFKKGDKGVDAKGSTEVNHVDVDQNTTVQKSGNAFDAFIRTPTFRIAFGGVLGGLTYFMVREMGNQQETAKNRKEALLRLKGDFENTQGMKICTPAERNDQSQPGCFCYTAEGGKNTARANSTVCQNMWNSANLNGNSYLADGDSTKVCITQSNAIDEKCSCRTSNTCMKANGFNISGISLGTLSTLGSGLAPIATVSNGNGASLNTDAVVNGAMKLRDATDKVLASNDLKNENAIVKAAEQSLGNFVQANGGTLSSPSARSMPSSLANFDAKAALEELKEEVESSPKMNGVATYGSGFDSQSQEPSLEFGLTPQEAAIQEEQVAEVLNQDMDLGNNDISGSSTNLFEVLSHRYQRSGMRRLFNLEDKTEADKPAKTDINQ